MLANEIATRVKRQFGDESNVQITDDDIFRWINDAIREVATANDLLQTTAVTSIVSGQQDYTLPNDILTLRSIRYNGKKLKGLSIQESEEYIDSDSAVAEGTPFCFWIYAHDLTIYPIPQENVVNGLKIYYTRQPEEVNAGGDTPEIPAAYHNRLVEYCLAQAYELDENWSASQLKAQQFTEGVKALTHQQDWTSQDFYSHITSSLDDC